MCLLRFQKETQPIHFEWGPYNAVKIDDLHFIVKCSFSQTRPSRFSWFLRLPAIKNKFMAHISGFFNGTKFRCAHIGYMRFPKQSKNVSDRFLSRFGVFFHFKSSKTTRYWVFYDKTILNLRVSFLFKLFLFIGKSVLHLDKGTDREHIVHIPPCRSLNRNLDCASTNVLMQF